MNDLSKVNQCLETIKNYPLSHLVCLTLMVVVISFAVIVVGT